MNIVCHLRDHRIQTPNYQPNLATSVFGAFVANSIFAHQELPIYSATEEVCNYDKQHHGSANRVFIVHPSNDTYWAAAFANGLQGHAVLTSTMRVAAVPAGWPQERSHPCEWTPEEFANPPARLTQWLQQLRTTSIDDIDWELLCRDIAEPVLAFRLLCEAWIQVHIKRCPELNGITVHAPSSIADWLMPFGSDATDVVRLFGGEEIQREAQAVLDAAQQNDNDALAKAVETILRSGLANA